MADNGPASSCELRSANISLVALSQPYYLATGSLRNSSVKAYLSLCKPLRWTVTTVSPVSCSLARSETALLIDAAASGSLSGVFRHFRTQSP
jgi:hypothetical protein